MLHVMYNNLYKIQCSSYNSDIVNYKTHIEQNTIQLSF